VPIVVTFDLSSPSPRELNRIRGVFERLGWEHLGNTAYRYPRLRDTRTEDWFNHVIPALMLLRALARSTAEDNRGLVRFTIDAQSSTGFSPIGNVGALPLPADQIEYSRPSPAGRDFSQRRLQDWLDSIDWPYAQDEQEDAP
jgi:hypothetical protein